MKLVAFVRRLACVLPVVVVATLHASVVWASHPLLTEDTGVPGRGVYEFELHGERVRAPGVRGIEAVAKLGHGLAETLDVEVELPYTRVVADGSETAGRGDVGLGAKWRFYDNGAFSAALKPELLLPTGRDELGLGAGRARLGREPRRVIRDWALRAARAPVHRGAFRGAREAMLGATYAVSDAVDVGLGFRRALNDAADERVRAGLKLRW